MILTEGRIVQPTPMRAAIARRMAESQSQIPHFYVSTEISTAAAEAYLREVSEAGQVRVSMTAALVRACAVALQEHPIFNAVWTDDGLLVVDDINIGVAIALDDGLIAPAVLDCGALDLVGTAERVGDLVERARAKKLRPPELTDATFTLSNLGMFDVASFIALIPPPQVGILAAGRSIRRAIAPDDDTITTGPVMVATLSADHRAVDGADAARFLGTFKRVLEHPEPLSHRSAEESS